MFQQWQDRLSLYTYVHIRSILVKLIVRENNQCIA